VLRRVCAKDSNPMSSKEEAPKTNKNQEPTHQCIGVSSYKSFSLTPKTPCDFLPNFAVFEIVEKN
jgi:hypothetical protein